MSYREGKMINPGRGESVWEADQNVTTDPASPNFLDERMFKAMTEAGAIDERGIEAAIRSADLEEPPKTKQRKTKKGKDADSDE